MTPMNQELNPSWRNSLIMITGVAEVISLVSEVYFITVLKRIILTASLVIPSPKTILKRRGCLSYSISEMAAITSLEQRRLHINRHSTEVISNLELIHSPVS
jgi:hypothetical protein